MEQAKTYKEWKNIVDEEKSGKILFTRKAYDKIRRNEILKRIAAGILAALGFLSIIVTATEFISNGNGTLYAVTGLFCFVVAIILIFTFRDD